MVQPLVVALFDDRLPLALHESQALLPDLQGGIHPGKILDITDEQRVIVATRMSMAIPVAGDGQQQDNRRNEIIHRENAQDQDQYRRNYGNYNNYNSFAK